MTYMRIKKVKEKEYGYLVKSKWKRSKKSKGKGPKGPKQKVIGYLGRVYNLEKVDDLDFWSTIDCNPEDYLKRATKDKILKDLVRFELLKHGFDYSETDRVWKNDYDGFGEITIDIDKKKIRNSGKSKCVLAINEGHLCDYKLKNMFSYDRKGDIEEVGLEMAKMFIDSGINIPQDVFITYYEKL